MQDSEQKTLIICGDSWFSTDIRYKGCSFGERLSARHNLAVENFARGGCSNFAVALQIDRAIQMRPDFIIAGCTTWDRVDLPIMESSNSLKEFLSWLDFDEHAPDQCRFLKQNGLLNIKYSHAANEESAQYSQPALETVVSESINNLIWNGRYDLDPGILAALKSYIKYLYDSGIKQQIDCWIMSDAARRLQASGIPFLLYVEPLFNRDYFDDITWLDSRYLVTYNDFSYNQYDNSFPAVFHLSPADAENFSRCWQARLMKEGFLHG